MIFYDAYGWQAYQYAFNIAPYVGGGFAVLGAINLAHGEKAGIVQIIMGLGLMAAGLFLK